MPFDRAVFENVPSIILQPKSAWCVLFGGVWRKPLEILRREGKAHVMGCGMRVGRLKAWASGCCSCWTTWLWYWVIQRVAVARQTSATLVVKFVSSLLPRSPSVSADGLRLKTIRPTSHLVQSVTDQTCISMLTNVGRLQRGLHLTRRLLVVLSAKAVRVASEEAQARKRSRSRSCAGVADQSRGRMETGPKSTRRKRTSTNSSPRCSGKPGLPAPPLRRVVLRGEPSHRSHGSSLRTR